MAPHNILTFFYQSYALFSPVFSLFQNAGAVIGKGGKNIKALRTDVSEDSLRNPIFFC